MPKVKQSEKVVLLGNNDLSMYGYLVVYYTHSASKEQ
jgi:hypothetical protein